MGYNHLKFITDVDEHIKIREAIDQIPVVDPKSERDKRILELYFIEGLSSYKISELNEFKSRKKSYISPHQVTNIVNDYFPDLMKRRKKPETIKTAIKKKTYRETTKIKKEFNPRVCCKCGKCGDVDLHHMIPQAFGGISELMNLIPLCEECHSEYTTWFKQNMKRMLLELIRYNFDLIKKIMED